MSQMLVLRDPAGQIMRVLPWKDYNEFFAVHRKDSGRVELCADLTVLEKEEIPFQVVKTLGPEALAEGQTVPLGPTGWLSLETPSQIHPQIQERSDTSDQRFRKATLLAVLIYILVGLWATRPWMSAEEPIAEAPDPKKREIVKIVRKKIKLPSVAKRRTVSTSVPTAATSKAPPKVVKKKVGWKQRGALAALGSLSKSNQKGGLNLGAVKTTAGPGLGGSQGSGGVQTNIYAKGLVSAPLGAGGNLKGGGGYGTKGRGGGKAGFGSQSLVGSSGASLIPVPSAASVDGGLSPDSIANVIRRNLGQIRFCYEKGLQLQPGLAGRVNMSWTIDGSGGVRLASVKNTSLNNKSVENCIVQRLRTWKFPIPQNNAEVKVSYPFLLKKAGTT